MGENIYVSRGQAQLAVDSEFVYLSELNEGDTAMAVAKATLTPGLTYGQTFTPNAAMVFDRVDGEHIVDIAAPSDVWGQPAQGVIYVDEKILAQTIPGCCGSGIFLYNPDTFALSQIIRRFYTNTVVRRGRWLIAGNEGGQVDVFDIEQNPAPFVSSAPLRFLTGHTGSEDIEIRALWNDRVDNLIFAGSSWGNTQSQSSSLPSFFVLELLTEQVGDLDVDGDVDQDDINILRAAQGKPVSGPDDPRDLDGDGRINSRDLKRIKTLCSRPQCATA